MLDDPLNRIDRRLRLVQLDVVAAPVSSHMPARSYVQTRVVVAACGCTAFIHAADQSPSPLSITTVGTIESARVAAERFRLRRCRAQAVIQTLLGQRSEILLGMEHSSSTPIDLNPIAVKFGLSPAVVEDLYARRRAGARDAELLNLLGQPDRGGLEPERAREVVAELPER